MFYLCHKNKTTNREVNMSSHKPRNPTLNIPTQLMHKKKESKIANVNMIEFLKEEFSKNLKEIYENINRKFCK